MGASTFQQQIAYQQGAGADDRGHRVPAGEGEGGERRRDLQRRAAPPGRRPQLHDRRHLHRPDGLRDAQPRGGGRRPRDLPRRLLRAGAGGRVVDRPRDVSRDRRRAALDAGVGPDGPRLRVQLQGDGHRAGLRGRGRLRAAERHHRRPLLEPVLVVRQPRLARRDGVRAAQRQLDLALRGHRGGPDRDERSAQPAVAVAGRVGPQRLAEARVVAVRAGDVRRLRAAARRRGRSPTRPCTTWWA